MARTPPDPSAGTNDVTQEAFCRRVLLLTRATGPGSRCDTSVRVHTSTRGCRLACCDCR